MAMELIEHVYPATVEHVGEERLVMPALAHLRFQNTADQGHFLDVTVPTGKKWSVTVTVRLVETDA